jgi:NADP-dependent 3-hydroxy acid dehydrogenase YdfG
MTNGRLAGRVGLVTGAANGIGQAVARAAVAEGAALCLLDRDVQAAASAAASLAAAGTKAIAAGADVRVYAEVEHAVALAREQLGEIDFLVANAGIGDYGLMSDGDPERWRAVMETNVLGVAYAIRAVLGTMKERGRGDVVLMSSIAGRQAWVGEPIYIASKWALVGLGHSLRLECESAGVRVTLVEPSIVDTPLVRSTPDGRDELEKFASLDPADVARAVVYVLGEPANVAVGELVIRPLGPGF